MFIPLNFYWKYYLLAKHQVLYETNVTLTLYVRKNRYQISLAVPVKRTSQQAIFCAFFICIKKWTFWCLCEKITRKTGCFTRESNDTKKWWNTANHYNERKNAKWFEQQAFVKYIFHACSQKKNSLVLARFFLKFYS